MMNWTETAKSLCATIELDGKYAFGQPGCTVEFEQPGVELIATALRKADADAVERCARVAEELYTNHLPTARRGAAIAAAIRNSTND